MFGGGIVTNGENNDLFRFTVLICPEKARTDRPVIAMFLLVLLSWGDIVPQLYR